MFHLRPRFLVLLLHSQHNSKGNLPPTQCISHSHTSKIVASLYGQIVSTHGQETVVIIVPVKQQPAYPLSAHILHQNSLSLLVCRLWCLPQVPFQVSHLQCQIIILFWNFDFNWGKKLLILKKYYYLKF
jgi:hypothetical protein